MGICEKHHLPLDRNGECELCRLSDMPSKAPPAASPWWALTIPLVLTMAGIAWAFSSCASEPEAVPEPPRPPIPASDVPKPSPEGAQIERTPPRPAVTTKADIPEWKWNLARRRVTITMYATQWCDVCRKAREYMEANRIDFIELDTDQSSAADERLGELNPRRTIPTFQIDELVYAGFREDLFETKLNQAARKHL